MSDFAVVLDFWFKEISSKQWFASSAEFDELIKSRFERLHQQAALGETSDWRVRPEGRLAEILVLDQFSRNIFRGTAKAFAYDPLALGLAQEAVRAKADRELNPTQKSFLYMPYMHSEDGNVHKDAVKLFSQPGLEFNLEFELKHKAIIDRFGRYPHRNKALSRVSTPEEIEFLKQPNSSF